MTPLHTPDDLADAITTWGANCGPGSIAAAFGLSLREVRSSVSDKRGRFPGYMGVEPIVRACRELGRPVTATRSEPPQIETWVRGPAYLMMVNIDGPWRGEAREQAKHRHIVAVMWHDLGPLASSAWRVYDVNAGTDEHPGGWLPHVAWQNLLMRDIARGTPGSSGRFFFAWRGTVSDSPERNT